MSKPPDYDNIPGTYVYDGRRGRIGYALNMFCMSLNKPENRALFKANAAAYLDRFPLTAEQRRTVLERDWLGMLRAGGNIYYTIKIAFCDGLTFQDVAGMMSGVSKPRALVAPPRQNTRRMPSCSATSKITSAGSKR